MKPTRSKPTCRKCGKPKSETRAFVDKDFCSACVPPGRTYLATINVRYYGGGYIARAVGKGVSSSSTNCAIVAAGNCGAKLADRFHPELSPNKFSLIDEATAETDISRFVLLLKV